MSEEKKHLFMDDEEFSINFDISSISPEEAKAQDDILEKVAKKYGLWDDEATEDNTK